MRRRHSAPLTGALLAVAGLGAALVTGGAVPAPAQASNPAPALVTVYSFSAALQAGKTVASATLPTASGGLIGVFAVGAG